MRQAPASTWKAPRALREICKRANVYGASAGALRKLCKLCTNLRTLCTKLLLDSTFEALLEALLDLLKARARNPIMELQSSTHAATNTIIALTIVSTNAPRRGSSNVARVCTNPIQSISESINCLYERPETHADTTAIQTPSQSSN